VGEKKPRYFAIQKGNDGSVERGGSENWEERLGRKEVGQ